MQDNQNKCFLFDNFKLNVAQIHDTTSQLYHTIDDFKIPNNGFFETNEQYRDHIVGKLKFFIDLYARTHDMLFINETVVLDNYYHFARIICDGYDEDAMSDVFNDYQEYLFKQIDDILDMIDINEITETDDVIAFIGSHEHLNFQEQQFILDCYYSTLKDYKIMRRVDNEYVDEIDYRDCRLTIAINDYCRACKCNHKDLLIREIYNDEEEYTGREFYVYLKQHNIDLDFVYDYNELKTIKQWLQYTINTMLDVNIDLLQCQDFDTIESNNKIIDALTTLLNN